MRNNHKIGKTFGMRAAAVLVAVYLAASGGGIPARGASLPSVEVTASAALLVDLGTGDVLKGINADAKVYPAGLTKIMTALLALENAASSGVSLDNKVAVTETAVAGLQKQTGVPDLQPGESMSMRDLLSCMLVASDNKASNVIAAYVAGSVPDFVALMNRRAKELGCRNTNFVNAHGLHDFDHYTTANDIYLITIAALSHPEFMSICDTRNSISVEAIGPDGLTPVTHMLSIKNDLIATRSSSNQYRYTLARGIITGNTSEGGHSIVSVAEKAGRQLLCAVLGAGERDGTIQSYVEIKNLFEWGFANFTTKTLLEVTEHLRKVKVFEGKDKDEVTLVPERKLEALVPQSLDIAEDVTKTTELYDLSVYAPVERGTPLGEVRVSYKVTDESTGRVVEREFDTIPLVASIKVERDETEHLISQIKAFITQDWFIYSLAGIAVAVLIYVTCVVVYNRRRHRRQSGRVQNYKGKKRRRRRG